jgi:hypothetical protein
VINKSVKFEKNLDRGGFVLNRDGDSDSNGNKTDPEENDDIDASVFTQQPIPIVNQLFPSEIRQTLKHSLSSVPVPQLNDMFVPNLMPNSYPKQLPTKIPYKHNYQFPIKLFDIISDSRNNHIIEWQNGGESFRVKNIDAFINDILIKEFNCKYNNYLFYFYIFM